MKKRILSLILVVALVLVGCGSSEEKSSEKSNGTVSESAESSEEMETTEPVDDGTLDEQLSKMSGLDDPSLLQYVEDDIYATIEEKLGSEDFVIDDIAASYVSKEYLEEIEYNSKENVFFGYSLSDIEKEFVGKKYVFTLGDSGETVVTEFVETQPDETFNTVLKNVLIGSGVILVFVGATLLTGGTAAFGAGAATAGVSKVGLIFAASAKGAVEFGLSSAVIGGLSSGVITGVQTGDIDEALKSALVGASEGFKVGAITGGVLKGLSAARSFAKKIPTPRESELRAMKKFKNSEEQVSFLNGERVPSTTEGATRPDLLRKLPDGKLEAIEVKNYDLVNNSNQLKYKLTEQVASRAKNCPKGTLQRVVLDVKNRGYSKEFLKAMEKNVKEWCSPYYKDIPVTILG